MMHNNIILDRATQLSLREGGWGGGVPRACFRIIAASCSVSTYLASVLLNVFDNMLLIPPPQQQRLSVSSTNFSTVCI